jgi:hypothetical protein
VAVPVDRALVGFVDTPAAPSTPLANRGAVQLEGPPVLTVRDHVTLRLVYTVGHHGLDDRGAFKIVMRFPFDGGAWQGDDPAARSYVSVGTEPADRCGFRSKFESYGAARPWFKAWTSQVVGGCLAEGERVVVTLGDRSGGSPGLRMQTFAEDAWELRFLVDPCGTGHFVEVPGDLWRPVVPGAPAAWRLVAPTRVAAGEPWWLGVKAEDAYGNPTPLADAALHLEASREVRGLPPVVEHRGVAAQRLEGLQSDPGAVWVTARDADGRVLAVSNPVVVDPGGRRTFWADLHGQSGETVGVNTARSYLGFARDRAFLDAAGHQANDFQIGPALWRQLDALVDEVEEPGRFVVLPGYEWSGNTAVGGDRNVYYRATGRPIRRSSHALLLDRSEEHTDCTTARALFAALRGEDAVAVAHVGGRWADLRYAHDDEVERAVEVHSDWGTFEWLVHDALEIGARVGIVANSDGHKGRPGASWPGASTFGAYGGLTCLTAEALTREALFDALRARRTVATTGCRLDLDVAVLGAQPGDVVPTERDRVEVAVRVVAPAPIHAVAVRVGAQDVLVHHPGASSGPHPGAFVGGPERGSRIAVRWAGALYRGRGREASWVGEARGVGVRLADVVPVALWNPDLPLEVVPDRVRFRAITTGNAGGFDAVLADEAPDARLVVETDRGRLDVGLADLDVGGVAAELGGLGLRLTAARLADRNPHREVSLVTEVPVAERGDTPIWVCVTLEDGHQAWSSPIYVHRTVL